MYSPVYPFTLDSEMQDRHHHKNLKLYSTLSLLLMMPSKLLSNLRTGHFVFILNSIALWDHIGKSRLLQILDEKPCIHPFTFPRMLCQHIAFRMIEANSSARQPAAADQNWNSPYRAEASELEKPTPVSSAYILRPPSFIPLSVERII